MLLHWGLGTPRMGASIQQKASQQGKGTHCWYVQLHGLISDALCQVKEARFRKVYTIWFHLHDIYKRQSYRGGVIAGGKREGKDLTTKGVATAVSCRCSVSWMELHVSVHLPTLVILSPKKYCQLYTLKKHIKNWELEILIQLSQGNFLTIQLSHCSYLHPHKQKIIPLI